ncbi:GNAT family N-acetyltransferase [Streptomyces xiaopingdaonensis]|uniref:GNAT family N-acetyltransferase n=1 Tax=Streptomyces xiaopingdaonensis TaxID=1565415 RepID=UPI0003760673|nr:GNAT family N-acetyltransferase [Streptomyces xiaopingdaonensis]
MTEKTAKATRTRPAPTAREPHRWRRELVELAALFLAVTVADTAAKTVVNAPDGPVTLAVAALVLLATVAFHTWWGRRRRHAAPDEEPPVPEEAGEAPTTLWRMRTTVREEPGALAALCGALADRRVDILALQTHPLGPTAVDELLLRAPESLEPGTLSHSVAAAGGSDTWLERADAHDLVDTPTRVLRLATRTALDPAELPPALRGLLGRCRLRWLPADGGEAPASMTETVLTLPDPAGGRLLVERPALPFTPTEFARARALVELDARLGRRLPDRRENCALPEGQPITVRRAGPDDLEAAKAMQARCSDETLTARYHGPLRDADRYLEHLLSPRFGRTLAAETASGRLVALGHLLRDGEEAEVALLVEDGWQRRGVGGALLRRLVDTARRAHAESVYAVTRASNTGMVAAMRSLGLPLDYRIEGGTLVISSLLTAEHAPEDAMDAGGCVPN